LAAWPMPGTSTEQISRCLPEGGSVWSLGGATGLARSRTGRRCGLDSPECAKPELAVDNNGNSGTAAGNCDAADTSYWLPTDCALCDVWHTHKQITYCHPFSH